MSYEENDITEEFFEACKELKLGELVQFKDFSLADAMSAIEIMDPKMDLGMVPFEDNLSFIKNGTINVNKIPVTDLIAVMDATISLIVSWLHGQSLDQTVYTNVCLLDVNEIKNQILLSFCLGALNFVQGLRLCIDLANVFDEEDYLPNTYWQNLHSEFTDSLKELDIALNTVRFKKEKDASEENFQYNEAIEARLFFLQQIFYLFSQLFSHESNFTPNFKSALLIVDQVLSSLDVIIKSVHLGTQPTEKNNDSDFSWLEFIKPQVNRFFLPPTFPKTLKIFSRIDSYKYLHKCLCCIKEMVFELPTQMHSLDGLLSFLKKFGSNNSCLLTRSISQLLVMPNDNTICGLYPLANIIAKSLHNLDLATNTSPNRELFMSDLKIQDDLNNFMLHLIRVFARVFQIFGHNLARQCDKLLRFCFEDFAMLKIQAYKIEQKKFRNCTENNYYLLSSFVMYHILQMMYYQFELSFKLDIFVPYEFSYVYWYFHEKIIKNFLSFYQDRYNLLLFNYDLLKPNFETTKSKQKQQQLHDYTDFQKLLDDLYAKILEYKSEYLISSALVKFLFGLKLTNRLQFPNREDLCYHQRFEIFSCLLAPSLYAPYETYESATKIKNTDNVATNQFFIDASEQFEEAISFLKNYETKCQTSTKSIKFLIKVIKQNSIVSKLLASSPNLKKKITFEKIDCSQIFPLIKLC